MSPDRKVRFLDYLKQNANKKISRIVIRDKLQLTPYEIESLIQSLKNYGISVSESETHIWLDSYPDIFTFPDLVLHTEAIGKKILPFYEVASTNDIALRLALQGEEQGTIVIAERQRKGRGKSGAYWYSPSDGGLWMSVIFRPETYVINVEKFTLMSALAVAQAVKELFDITAEIRWPNDVLLNGKKFCGILSEGKLTSTRLEFIIVGIGLNVNIEAEEFPRAIQQKSTSLKLELTDEISRVEVFSNLVFNLDRNYKLMQEDPTRLLELWRSYSRILGKRILVRMGLSEVRGLAIDYSPNGFLILRLDSGIEETIMSGSIVKIFE